MATQVKINDVVVLEDKMDGKTLVSSEDFRKALSSILTTKNPLTDGIAESLNALPNGAAAFLEVVKKSGKMDDVFLVEDKPQGKTAWEFAASCTRKTLIARLTLAINRKDYEVTLPKGETTKTAPANVVKATITSL